MLWLHFPHFFPSEKEGNAPPLVAPTALLVWQHWCLVIMVLLIYFGLFPTSQPLFRSERRGRIKCLVKTFCGCQPSEYRSHSERHIETPRAFAREILTVECGRPCRRSPISSTPGRPLSPQSPGPFFISEAGGRGLLRQMCKTPTPNF